MSKRDVTYIDQLIDISDLEGDSTNILNGNEFSSIQNNTPISNTPNPTFSKEISCIEIAEHIKNCPVCTQLYNSERTIYVIIIVILAVILIMLLKKILETK